MICACEGQLRDVAGWTVAHGEEECTASVTPRDGEVRERSVCPFCGSPEPVDEPEAKA